MGRPKKSAPKHVEPEEESQEIPEEEPAAVIEPEEEDETGALPAGAVSQTDAARGALDKGYEKPAEAVKYIKDTFGIDMNPQYFSAIKTRLGKSGAKRAPATEPTRRGPKPKAAAPAVQGYVAPPEKPKAAGDQVDLIAAMEAMKPLVAALGADKVKRIADLLG